MEKYIKKLVALMVLCALMASGIADAKVRAVKARRDFEQSVAKESMVVALFYDAKNKDLVRMYEDVSGNQSYDAADVVFLKVNAARADLAELATLYGVTTMPTFIFFHNGKRLIDNNGAAIMLTGSVTRDELQSFIDMHYGTEIKTYIAQKDKRNDQRFAQENESWKLYFYPRDMVVPSYGPEERTLE
jgi:hypothetical protein